MTIIDAKRIFGINGAYNINELKSIYYRLARKEHPDISSDTQAEEKMKLINEAYSVLKSNSSVTEVDNDFYEYKQNIISGIKNYIEVDYANEKDLKLYGYDIILKIRKWAEKYTWEEEMKKIFER